MALSHVVSELFAFANVVTLKPGSEVTEGHWKWHWWTGYGFLL